MFSTLFAINGAMSQKSVASQKVLVVYFSRSGNTEMLASYIKEATGGDLFRIEPVDPYPEPYKEVVDQAKKEIAEGYKPPVKGTVERMNDYNIVFVGSPNWWGTIAPPVASFLAGYDLTGKTIVPFITHEGSRMGRSLSDIRNLCPASTVSEGIALRGGSVAESKGEVLKWVAETLNKNQ